MVKRPGDKDAVVDFSVITVTYNCEANLEKTVLSVINQTSASFEYIIVDGQSTDGTVSVINQYQDSVDKWISEKDSGIYDAMNKGVSLASGRWVLFLNAGDVLAAPDVLQQVAGFIGEKGTDIVYGNILVEQNGELVERKALPPQNKHRMYFCHQAAFVRTDCLRALPFDTRFRMSADFHFFKNCFRQGYVFKQLPLTITVYDLNGISNTSRAAGLKENIRIVKELDRKWERIKHLLKLYFVVYRIGITAYLNN